MRRFIAMPVIALLAAAAFVAINPLSSGAAAPCRLSKSVDSLTSYSEKKLLAEIRAGGCITITYGGKVIGQLDSLTTAAPTSSAAPKPSTSSPKPTSAAPSPTKTTASPTPTKTTSAAPSTTMPTTQPPSGAKLPAQVLDLSKWYEGLPIETPHDGTPDCIYQPELAGYSHPDWFLVNPAGTGVVFRARADGAHTGGSKYPRSELREMTYKSDNDDEASWSNRTGIHTMTLRQSIDRVDSIGKPEIVVAQIHGGDDDLMQVKLTGQRLEAVYNDGDTHVLIDPAYRLGAVYDLTVRATSAGVDVVYNGATTKLPGVVGTSNYFKAGAYLQFSSEYSPNTKPSDIGQVTIYSLTVSH